jgi:glycosyltransferase involved in cell wall biosynthesis
MEKITIITVVYNSVNLIEGTINSVIQQDYVNKEFIIIDGLSSDGTVEIIKKYNDNINIWKSEIDNGIYDAMNKALQYVTGDWIIFMNSGDQFINNHVLKDLSLNKSYDLYFGATKIKTNDFKDSVKYPLTVNKLWKGMICCHQSIIFRSDLFKKYIFDIKYTLSADYNLIYTLIRKENAKIFFTNNIISIYYDEGVSKNNYINVLQQNMAISNSFSNNFLFSIFILTYFQLKLFYYKFKIIIK